METIFIGPFKAEQDSENGFEITDSQENIVFNLVTGDDEANDSHKAIIKLMIEGLNKNYPSVYKV